MRKLRLTDHKSLSTGIADAIRDAIERGELRPGERLIERRLAEQLGVSHIPVREALARLEDEGLVNREPRRGARVADLSERDLEEIASVRIVLEELVVDRAMAHWTPAGESELDAIVSKMIERAKAGDAEALIDLDRRFHETVWRLADHHLLLQLAGDIRLRINRFLRAATMSLSPEALVRHAEQHGDLVAVMSSGDVAAGRQATRHHIVDAMQRIKSALAVTDAGG